MEETDGIRSMVVRDINCTTLNRVIGACLETVPEALLVTEHCAKGSLQDLLGNPNFSLDAQFKFSLAIDVAEGMCFLTQSSIGYHGNLSSSVCLIDNRFSVKITDYGLPSLFCNEKKDYDSQEYKTECLWKAPEVLRSVTTKGSKEADVYSYGIILYEILSREQPFFEETGELGTSVVLEKLKAGGSPLFRPKLDLPLKMKELAKLISECWQEHPSSRPDFPRIKQVLRLQASRFGESVNLLDNLLRRMELYANNLEKMVEDKTQELVEEKKRSEQLLYEILPKSVAENLKLGLPVEPEAFESVTIYFSDIVGFTDISARSTPLQVVDLLNDLYSCFDAIIDTVDVYKVETIGDAYMVVSGLPDRNGDHAQQIATLALLLRQAIDSFIIKHLPDEKVQLRIGIHTGPTVAGVVGLKMPRYCLFGDTVNTASRMESCGEAMKIHISSETYIRLEKYIQFTLIPRGEINVKGKGNMATYWLEG
ncbi:atrial natriuretic peptide receptor 1 [Patella vulgata]|uniref:atrial natriuretic peptide receptor 1 n=1 Tax=Patella vulgata TaxID=6465 RepID=UPI0024A92EAD|nr:atrial natriuretic peptide receptor 1 [Patella vulgata]